MLVKKYVKQFSNVHFSVHNAHSVSSPQTLARTAEIYSRDLDFRAVPTPDSFQRFPQILPHFLLCSFLRGHNSVYLVWSGGHFFLKRLWQICSDMFFSTSTFVHFNDSREVIVNLASHPTLWCQRPPIQIMKAACETVIDERKHKLGSDVDCCAPGRTEGAFSHQPGLSHFEETPTPAWVSNVSPSRETQRKKKVGMIRCTEVVSKHLSAEFTDWEPKIWAKKINKFDIMVESEQQLRVISGSLSRSTGKKFSVLQPAADVALFVIPGAISHGLSSTSTWCVCVPLHMVCVPLPPHHHHCPLLFQLSPHPLLHSIFPTHLTSLSSFFSFSAIPLPVCTPSPHLFLPCHIHPFTLWLSFQTDFIPKYLQAYIQTLPIIFCLFKVQVCYVKRVQHSRFNFLQL